MKKLNVILAVGLSLTLGVSVATGIFAGADNKAEPAQAGTATTVYCAISSSTLGTYSFKLNTNHKGDGDDWHQYTMVATGDTYDSKPVYSASFTDTWGGLGAIQFQLYDGSSWKAQDQVFGVQDWHSADVYNGKLWVYGSTGSDRTWKSYTPPTPVEPDIYSYSINNGAYVEMEDNTSSEVMSKTALNLQVGDTLKFKKNGEDYAVEPKDSFQHETRVSMVDGVLTVVQAYNDIIYLDHSVNQLWAGAYTVADGQYLFGTHNSWQWLKSAIALPADDIELEENAEFKAVNVTSNAWGNSDWVDVSSLHARPTTYAETTEGGNVKINQTATFDVSVDSGHYRVVKSDYVPVTDGFYLAGSWDWSTSGLIEMTENEDGPEGVLSYKALNVSLDDGDEFVGVAYSDDDATYANPTYIQCDHPTEFPVSIENTNGKVTNGGHYDIYMNKDQNGNTTWGYYLVAKDYVEPTYDLLVNGAAIEMTEGEDNQYYALGVSLEAGDSIEYAYNNIGITDSTAKVVSNNNLKADKTVLVDATADVYVNIVTKTIWVSGLPNTGYHIILNDHELITMTKGDDFEGFEQYYSDFINFIKDDVLRFVNCTPYETPALPSVFDITRIDEGGLADNFEVNTDNHLECISACSAMVYLKLKFEQDEVYFGDVRPEVLRAIEYAEDFMDKIEVACNDGEPVQGTLVSAWNAQKTTYLGLDEAVQTELLKGSSSSVQEIKDFAAMYKYVFGRRHSWGLDNFLNWDIPTSSNIVIPTQNNNYIAIIVVVSIIIISTVGFAFFSLKKKRQH